MVASSKSETLLLSWSLSVADFWQDARQQFCCWATALLPWKSSQRVLPIDGSVHVQKKSDVKPPEDNVIKSQLLCPLYDARGVRVGGSELISKCINI